MKCVDPVIEIKVDEIIRNKCGLIYNEAMSIVNDAIALEKYKDLFIEQSKRLQYYIVDLCSSRRRFKYFLSTELVERSIVFHSQIFLLLLPWVIV
jgi:membrane protein CcdC involved in cytochrome C biogenesis